MMVRPLRAWAFLLTRWVTSRLGLGGLWVGTDVFPTDKLQVAGRQEEIGQLGADEWLNSGVDFLEKPVAEDQMFS